MFPACAGMILLADETTRFTRGVPRLRGDDLYVMTCVIYLLYVFPARAGMIRYFDAVDEVCRCVPRLRGDDPTVFHRPAM